MGNQQPQISEDCLFYFEKQEVIVNDFDFPGYILDIGGGGEGVIGKLKGEQVIAIDPNKRELEEAELAGLVAGTANSPSTCTRFSARKAKTSSTPPTASP